jgi:hypothetical protein
MYAFQSNHAHISAMAWMSGLSAVGALRIREIDVDPPTLVSLPRWGFAGGLGLPHDSGTMSCHPICYGQISYATTDRKTILAMCSIGKGFGCVADVAHFTAE